MNYTKYRAYTKDKSIIGLIERGQDQRGWEDEFIFPNDLYNQDITVEMINVDEFLTNEIGVNQISQNQKEIRVYYNKLEFDSFDPAQVVNYDLLFGRDDYQNPISVDSYYLVNPVNYNYYKIISKKRDIKTFVKYPYSLVLETEIKIEETTNDKFIIVKNLKSESWIINLFKDYDAEAYNSKLHFISLIPNFDIQADENEDTSQTSYTYNDILSSTDDEVQYQYLTSLLNNKDIVVDYSDKDNFVHFGSAESLLERFVYRVFTKKDGYGNLSGYESYLLENWTKVDDSTNKYSLVPIDDLPSDDFYYTELEACREFDENNADKFIVTFIPEYLLIIENKDFIRFVNFIGNVLDSIRVRSKSIRDKYKLLDFNKDSKNIKMLLSESKFFLDSNFDFQGIEDHITKSNIERLDLEIWQRLAESLPYLRASKGTMSALKAMNNIYGHYFDITDSGESIIVYRYPYNDGDTYIDNDENFKLLFKDETGTTEYINNSNNIGIGIEITLEMLETKTINEIMDSIDMDSIDSESGGQDLNYIQPIFNKQVDLLAPFKANIEKYTKLNYGISGLTTPNKPGNMTLKDNKVDSNTLNINISKSGGYQGIVSATNKSISFNKIGRSQTLMIDLINTTKRVYTKTVSDTELVNTQIEKFGSDDVKIDVISATNTKITTSEE